MALLAFSPLSSRFAFAHSGGGNGGGYGGGGNGGGNGGGRGGGGGPYQAPELDAATAVQGLVLIGGALVLIRSYRRAS